MSNQQGYTIPKDMKADILIKGNLTLKDIVIILIFLASGFIIANFVGASGFLKVLIIIIQLVLGFLATMKPPRNPDKPMYLVVYSMFKVDKNGYRCLDRSKYLKKEIK